MLLICMLVLAGCASVPIPEPAALNRTARLSHLAAHPDWRFEGRVAYSHQGQGGSVRIVWQQSAEHAEILLSAPLAAGSISIRLGPDSAQIINADGKLMAQGTPDSVFMQALQVPVPATGLPDGLRAYWPQAPELTEAAMAGSVTVDGWQWQYLEWQDAPVRLPKRIELRRGETRLRILIDVWQELSGE